MSGQMIIETAGPAMSIQDTGRTGYLAQGLTRGGAADILALCEGAALLGQSTDCAAIEMVGIGGTFTTTIDTVIALTGARMTAKLDGAQLVWNASHTLPAGAKLTIGGAVEGTYGYLHIAGGFQTDLVMGARSSHLKSGIGAVLKSGQRLPIMSSTTARSGYYIAPDNRLAGGEVHVVSSIQTAQFADDTRARFSHTVFTRDARANRQGVRMANDGEGFFADGGLSIVSEVISEGDIQITGDGAPYILMCECQTTGGYPRIGTVIPSDLPRAAQASVGAPLRFTFITLAKARAIEQKARAHIKALPTHVKPLVRDPRNISDLLSYQLISGAVSATAEPLDLPAFERSPS
ncbi:MAG: biotin-dependent carboxyltransferase family protein [Roseobacter sp.]